MANIFKPRRGKSSVMNSSKSDLVLESGEMFVEFPDTGIGTGLAKVKFGDGTTQYSSLPYAIDILNIVYPVGSVYLSINNINPSTFIGGTWELLSDGYVLKTITSGDGGVASDASATGGPSTDTSGGPSTNTSGGPSNNTSGAASGNTGTNNGNTGAASGSTGTPSNNATGAASGNTGSTTLTAAQSGCPAHAHGGTSDLHFVYGKSNGEITLSSGNGAYRMTTAGATKNSSATNASSGHTHTLNSHTHTLNNHTHSLNSHTHTLNSHAHSLNSHTHTLSNHTHTLSSHTHSLSNHTHTTGMPKNISIYAWKRTA